MNRAFPLLVLVALAGCRPADSDPQATPPPMPEPGLELDQPKDDGDNEQAQAKTGPEPHLTFEQELAALAEEGLDGLPAAVELFRSARHFEGVQDPGSARVEALAALIAFGDEIAGESEVEIPFEAACERSKFCGGDDPTPAQNDRLDELEGLGLRAVYAGEGTFMLQGNVAWWRTQLDGALTPAETLWLDTTVLEQDASEHYDEDGYGGSVGRLATIALAYEQLLATKDPAYRDIAARRVCGSQASLLFSCDHGDFENPACTIDKRERSEWKAVIKANPDTSTAKVAAAFLKAMKAQRYRASSDALHAIVARLLPECVDP